MKERDGYIDNFLFMGVKERDRYIDNSVFLVFFIFFYFFSVLSSPIDCSRNHYLGSCEAGYVRYTCMQKKKLCVVG